MNTNKEDRLDTPIFLDYDVNNLTIIRFDHAETIEAIKGFFKKHGFKEKRKTNEGITIFEKHNKKASK